MVLTPDTFTERAELPPAESLRGDLLLADRGYFDRAYLRNVDRHGGHFLIRAQPSINPVIDAVNRGARAAKVVGHALKDVQRYLSQRAAKRLAGTLARRRRAVHLSTGLTVEPTGPPVHSSGD